MNCLVVYGKPGCSLCEKALDVVRKCQGDYGYEINYVNIEDDESLYERYRYEIPVVVFRGVEVIKGKVSELWFRRAMNQLNSRLA